MHKFVQLTLLGVFAAAGATLAVCVATTVDAWSVAGKFQPWSEEDLGVGYSPVVPSTAPAPVELTPRDNPPLPGKIAQHEPHEETPAHLWPADAGNIQPQHRVVNSLARYEHLIVAAGRWLGQRHQQVHAMGQAQLNRAATDLARLMPPANQTDAQYATDTSTTPDVSALPADAAATDSWRLQPTRPLLAEAPVSISRGQRKLAWAADTRKIQVRPRPATATRLSVTADGVDKSVEGILNNSPHLPAERNPAHRQAAGERTDNSHR